MALTDIEKVRLNVGDVDPVLPILDDASYQYFLDNNNGSITRASYAAASCLLFKLSLNSSDKQVDVLSIKGSKAAAAYIEALKLYIRSPQLNPIYDSVNPYGSGISKSDMLANDTTPDNNYVKPFVPSTDTTSTDPWRI